MDQTRRYPGPTVTTVFVILVSAALAVLSILSGQVVGTVLAIAALALATFYITVELRGGRM